MTPADLLLITQLIALGTQAASALISLRSEAATAQNSTMQQNLDEASANLQLVVKHAGLALTAGSAQPVAENPQAA